MELVFPPYIDFGIFSTTTYDCFQPLFTFRETQMKPTQDWGSVWPTHRTFQPSAVPLPIRQGATQTKGQITPAKYANPELMKIPNFLHLTPPIIKRQCNKLKEFCTPWPEGWYLIVNRFIYYGVSLGGFSVF